MKLSLANKSPLTLRGVSARNETDLIEDYMGKLGYQEIKLTAAAVAPWKWLKTT
jgi:hypothetical protein